VHSSDTIPGLDGLTKLIYCRTLNFGCP